MGDRRTNIKRWQMLQKVKSLDDLRGYDNGLFSLVVPYPASTSRFIKQLNDEYKKASLTEDRPNRLCYFWAIESAKKKLKEIERVRFDGLALFTGTIIKEEGKEERFITDFIPFKPVKDSVYNFDHRFHTETLHQLLEVGDKFGIIVMDRRGVIFGTLRGNTHEILQNYRFPAELPWSHDVRGDHMNVPICSYHKQSAEFATQYYFDPLTSRANVTGLIIAGEHRFMSALREELHPNLQETIMKEVEVQYGEQNGFNQAVEVSAGILRNLRFTHEKRVLRKFFHEVSSEEHMYFFGLDDSLNLVFQFGAIHTLIIWEDLDVKICVMKSSGRTRIKHLKDEQEGNAEISMDSINEDWDVVEQKTSLVEWLAAEYTRFGFRLDLVSNHSQEGYQFCKGFQGIGGILLRKRTGDDEDDSEDGETAQDDDDGEIPDDDFLKFWDDL